MKLFSIPMPWKTRAYCITYDDFGIHRPIFAAHFKHVKGSRVWEIRFGWGYRCAGPHECRDGINMGSDQNAT